MITGSWDKTAKVRNASTGDELFPPLVGHSGAVWATAFSPDGQRIVTGAFRDKTARVWDATNGQLLHRLEHDYGVKFPVTCPRA